MMAYLTRPTVNRVEFADGTKKRPQISNVNFKQVISDSFKKIFNKKGKVSISDIVSDTGYSKPTIYKYLPESQSAKLISQPSPFRDKVLKEVNKIIDDVFKNKKPLINASPSKIFEKIYGKKFNIKTDNIGVIKKILEENPNWSKIREAVTNTSTRVGAGNKIFETVKFKDFDKALAKAMKSRSLTRASTVEEFILRDLKRHIDQGGTKFEFAKGNSFEKGFKGLKIKDLTKGDTIDFAAIKKDDPRFKEYKKIFNDIKKLKLTPYTNPVNKEKTTLLKGLQQATGVDAPLNIQHAKGVAVEPLKNLSIATYKANIGAKMVGSVEDVETLGIRSTIPGGKRVYGPKLSFKDEVNRLTKFSDRMIKGAGTRTLKTPTETLTKTSGPQLSANPFLDPKNILRGLGDVVKVLGTPSVSAGFAGSTVKKNLEEGQSLLDATTDKMVGIDLLYPEIAKQTVGKFAQPAGKGILSTLARVAANPFGKAARLFTPVGAGITAVGLGKDYYDFVLKELERKEADPEAYAVEQEEQMGISAW